MTTPAMEGAFCSDLSLQAGEPVYASAPQAQAYLLLEFNGIWGEKALDDSDIPEPVKRRLNELGAQVKGLKTLLIKTDRDHAAEARVRFFVATLSAQPPRLHAFWLADYPDLLGLDVPAILAGDAAYDSHLFEAPLYLVCANGRRDRCCARHGVPVYHALTAALPASAEPQVWQCTHLGGHRFAANLVCLPHGLAYGRVRADSALAILDADRSGRIYLPNLRGRVSDKPVVQAAEYYLRQESGAEGRDDFCPVDAQELGPGEWAVRLLDRSSEKIVHVHAKVTSTEERVFESCMYEKTTTLKHYDLNVVEWE